MVLREIFLKLGLDVDTQKFAKGQLAADAVKLALNTAATAAIKLAHSFYENIKGSIEYGDHLDEVSQSVGVATDALQEFRYAASLSGVSSEGMDHAIMKLSRTMAAAKDGSEEASKAFKGIKFQEGGKLRDTGEVIEDIAAQFKKMPDGAEKTARAMQLFGRTGAQLIPFLNAGKEGVAELRQEARDLGLVMDEKAIKASAELGDNLDRLHATTKGLWRSAIAPLLPTLNDIVAKFLAWRKENAILLRQKLTGYIGAFIKAVKIAAHAVVGFYKGAAFAFTKVWEVLKLLSKGAEDLLGFLGGSFKYIVFGALAFAFSPLLVAAAIIGGLLLILDDYRGYLAGEDSMIGRWKDAVNEWLKPNEKDVWFVAAIKEFIKLVKEAIALISELPQGLRDSMRSWELFKKSKYGFDLSQLTPAEIYEANELFRRADKRGGGAGVGIMDSGIWDNGRGDRFNAAVAARAATPAPNMSMPRGGASVSNSIQMSVVTQPGQSNEQISSMVSDQMQSFFDGKMEEAAASQSRP